jgi:hypothetical protein
MSGVAGFSNKTRESRELLIDDPFHPGLAYWLQGWIFEQNKNVVNMIFA